MQLSAKLPSVLTLGPSSPIAVKSLGPMHESARQFLVDLGRKITDRSVTTTLTFAQKLTDSQFKQLQETKGKN